MSQISNNPLLLRQQIAEYTISGIPWVVSSTASAVKGHYFTDQSGIELDSQWVSVTNTGLSGSLSVAFVSGGFATSNCFALAPSESFYRRVNASKIYVSGNDAQPYQVMAGLTRMENKASTNSRFTPEKLSGLYGWWDASTGITISSSVFVSRWTDRTNGHVLVSSGALMPAYSSSNVLMGNRETLYFNGANKLISNESSASWGFLHNTSGSTVAFCASVLDAGLRTIYSTTATSADQTPGIACTISGTQNRISIRTGASTQTININNLPLIQNVDWGCVGVRSGSLATKLSQNEYASTAITAVQTGSVPTQTLHVGSGGQSTWFMFGYISELVVYNRTLTATEMGQLGQYFVKKYSAII